MTCSRPNIIQIAAWSKSWTRGAGGHANKHSLAEWRVWVDRAYLGDLDLLGDLEKRTGPQNDVISQRSTLDISEHFQFPGYLLLRSIYRRLDISSNMSRVQFFSPIILHIQNCRSQSLVGDKAHRSLAIEFAQSKGEKNS